MKAGILRIDEKLDAEPNTHTLKRLLKSRDYIWKRMRRSSRGERNERDFRTAKAHLAKLRPPAKPRVVISTWSISTEPASV